MTQTRQYPSLYDATEWGEADISSGKGAQDENFPVGSLLISRKLRPHVQAYYDFARVIDDIADSTCLNSEEKIKRLNAMENVLCNDVPAPDRKDVLTARYLRNSFLETGVSFDTATDLIIAFRQDAVKNRYQNFDELVEYCRFSANPVGHFLLDLHGEEQETRQSADALCTSLQILNHLQDCQADLIKLDRCYIPLDMMAAENVDVHDIKASQMSSSLRRVFDHILDRVDELNQQAAHLVRLTRNRRLRMESAVILDLARSLTIHLKHADPLAGRVKLTAADAAKAVSRSFLHVM